jgi:hypothetical protein
MLSSRYRTSERDVRREHPKFIGVRRHETSALTGQEAENSAALEAENPGELSEAASAAVCRMLLTP